MLEAGASHLTVAWSVKLLVTGRPEEEKRSNDEEDASAESTAKERAHKVCRYYTEDFEEVPIRSCTVLRLA